MADIILVLLTLINKRMLKTKKLKKIIGEDMIIATTDTIAGKEITQTLGMARGSTIQAKHIGKDIMSGLRSVVGGELTEYSEMLEEAREKAVNRMVEDAGKMGADAVVNVRFMTSMVMAGAAEMLAYGTAVKIRDKE